MNGLFLLPPTPRSLMELIKYMAGWLHFGTMHTTYADLREEVAHRWEEGGGGGGGYTSTFFLYS
jgi:hypothetical protein